MALPIRETPILTGENARRFKENTENAWKNPVSREEYERAKKTYEEFVGKGKKYINDKILKELTDILILFDILFDKINNEFI